MHKSCVHRAHTMYTQAPLMYLQGSTPSRRLTTTPCNPSHPPPPPPPLHISLGIPVRPWLAGTARLLRLQWRRGASGGRHYIGLQPPCIRLQPPIQTGVVLCQADLPALQRHLLTHFERRPPDHLLFEWFSGERADTRALAAGRSYRIFRHNLFFHIGTKSTINQPSHRFIPGCYALPARPNMASAPLAGHELGSCAYSGRAWRLWGVRRSQGERPGHWARSRCLGYSSGPPPPKSPIPLPLTAQALLYDWLLPAEVFNEKDCPDDDVWPCSSMSRVPS